VVTELARYPTCSGTVSPSPAPASSGGAVIPSIGRVNRRLDRRRLIGYGRPRGSVTMAADGGWVVDRARRFIFFRHNQHKSHPGARGDPIYRSTYHRSRDGGSCARRRSATPLSIRPTRATSWTDRRLNRVKAEITSVVNVDRRDARLRIIRDLILRTSH